MNRTEIINNAFNTLVEITLHFINEMLFTYATSDCGNAIKFEEPIKVVNNQDFNHCGYLYEVYIDIDTLYGTNKLMAKADFSDNPSYETAEDYPLDAENFYVDDLMYIYDRMEEEDDSSFYEKN